MLGISPIEHTRHRNMINWMVNLLAGVVAYTHQPQQMPRPDLVSITAFISQANRTYEVASYLRRLGVLVVTGGIHATVCVDKAIERVDSVVTGEAENGWAQLLDDVQHGGLKRRYDGGRSESNG